MCHIFPADQVQTLAALGHGNSIGDVQGSFISHVRYPVRPRYCLCWLQIGLCAAQRRTISSLESWPLSIKDPHLSLQDQNKLLVLLTDYEELFDGTLDDWDTELVSP